MPPVNKHVLRSEQTRAALIAAARPLFAERGYANVSTEELVRAAGVTRGALYHQFDGKAGLFRAVVEQVQDDLAQRVGGAEPPADADVFEGFYAGVERFLDACLEPDVGRIVLIDGPAVLGWEAWREIEEAHALGLTRRGLEVAMELGVIARLPVDPLAHILLGAVDEAGLYVARADDPRRAREEAGAALRRLLEGLR
jgi:AcrR family transcriptional regulator